LGYDDEQDFYLFTVPFSGYVTFSHYHYGRSNAYGQYGVLDTEGNSVNSFYNNYDYNKGYANDTDSFYLKKGTYYLKVYGRNGFYNFKITVKPDSSAIAHASRTKTKAKLTLKKVSGVTGYIVQYSTSEKFSKKSTKSKTVKSTSLKLSGLNKNKKYYVRVRSYKTWQGKTYYSSYSSTYVLY
jgi:hypothetical protein